MLAVEIGYYKFIFSDYENGAALSFAKTAHDHLSKEDERRRISITFLNENEEEETE